MNSDENIFSFAFLTWQIKRFSESYIDKEIWDLQIQDFRRQKIYIYIWYLPIKLQHSINTTPV